MGRAPENIGELIADIRDMRRKMEMRINAYGRDLLLAAFQAFFRQFPEVDAIRWTQYTPYFNDGAPCTFGIGEPSLLFSTLGPEADENGGDNWVLSWDAPENLRHVFMSIPLAFDDDIMLQMFGDHAEVTVRRNGNVEVEECQHD